MEDDTSDIGDYDSLSNDGKVSLIPSKLSLNEHRVKNIQQTLDCFVPMKKRVTQIETVVRSHSGRLGYLNIGRSIARPAAGGVVCYLRIYRKINMRTASKRQGVSSMKK